MTAPLSQPKPMQSASYDRKARGLRSLPEPAEIELRAAYIRRTWPQERQQRKIGALELQLTLDYLLSGSN